MAKYNKTPAISPRRNPSDPTRGIWQCKVKLPDKSRHAVSLGVPWPGNVREATDRAAELQREVDDGRLIEVLKWLGEGAIGSLRIKLGLKVVERDDAIKTIYGEPKTWLEARSAWLSTYPDRKVVSGKVHDADFTRKGYESRTRIFCKWADESGIEFKGKSATTVTILFLRDRRAGESVASKAGVSLGSLDNDVRVLHTWFGWLHRKGWYDHMDKDTVYDDEVFGGDDDAGENFVPDWQVDLATLQKMHESRFSNDAAFSAWRLFVLVRGLGCRPKEAFTLSWDTVQVDEGVVTFKNTKEEKLKSKRRGRSRRAVKDRPVPIVFQWVQDALNEIKALGAKRGTAVAVNTDGSFHRGSGQASNAFGRQLRVLGLKRPGYNLKACQRAALNHLEQILPPWVVARIAGHSLDIHMQHYSVNNSHMPAQKGRDYGQFERLSRAGLEMAAKYQQPSLVKEMLSQGKL